VELTLRTLRYVVAVVDEGGFGAAARAVHVSGPALSKQIRVFEKQAGVVLLDRQTRPVRPTPEGAEFIEAARSLIRDADAAQALLAAAVRRRNGTIAIGFPLAFAGPLTKPIIDAFTIAEPDVEVALTELSFGQQSNAVLRSAVDAGFVRAPYKTHPDLRFELIFAEPRLLVISAEHPLAGRASVRTAEMAGLRQARYVGDLDEEWARWWAADPRPDGSRPDYGATFHEVTGFLDIIARGDHVGITTPSLADQSARPDIRFIPIEDLPASTVHLCTRRHDRSRPIGTLRRVTAQVARRFAGADG
jgi:DNA-binding transcriptional LysR family regulator